MRSRVLAAAALVAGATGFSGAAGAEIQTMVRAGSWEAFSGTTDPRAGTDQKSRKVCGVSQITADNRYVSIKFFEGDATFTMQLGWRLWRVNHGDRQQVVVTMDANPSWSAKDAAGMHFKDGDAGLELTVRTSQLDDFMREFRNAGRLRLQFPGSGAEDWNVTLNGSSAVTDAFDRCRRGMGR
jgi:hypothetical protein